MLESVIPGADGLFSRVSIGELLVGLLLDTVPQAVSNRTAEMKVVTILEMPEIFKFTFIESRPFVGRQALLGSFSAVENLQKIPLVGLRGKGVVHFRFTLDRQLAYEYTRTSLSGATLDRRSITLLLSRFSLFQ